jgi:hypothetical protein
MLSISDQTIYNWRRQHLIDIGQAPGIPSSENAELIASLPATDPSPSVSVPSTAGSCRGAAWRLHGFWTTNSPARPGIKVRKRPPARAA